MTVAVHALPTHAADEALDRARAHLLSLQHRDGWWKGELETNVTIDAEDLFLRRYLGLEDDAVTAATAKWIRSKQRDDGTWATFYGGPGDLSTTVEAYIALRLAGDPVDAGHMRQAAEFIRDGGGIERSRVFTRMWLSLISLWRWADVPAIPPELIFLPPRAPLSIYSFGCWARQTIVALSIVSALRPTTTVPFAVDELLTGAAPQRASDRWGRAFELLDRGVHRYERRPVGALRRRALRAAEQWVVERQERDGSWGGIQPPWVWSMIGLHALGYRVDHPVLGLARDGLDSFTVEDEQGRRIEACQSPVWDSALALIALLDAGLRPGDDPIHRGAHWLARREIGIRGDWAVRRPDIPTGGFPFEFENDNYPDVDDTAVVVLALRRAANGDATCRQAADRGLAWAVGMQSEGGGWGAFDVDNTSELPLKLPFCDFGAVTDPPSADVTAHMVEVLGFDGLETDASTRRGLDYLLREQERDGSWFGRWGANHLYGTGAAVPALAACGLREHPGVRAAVAWLDSVQNIDGGFGEDLRSYRERSWRDRGESTASQTAWALLAYHAAGADGPAVARPAVDRAVRWLVETQRPGGGWDEPQYTGTGFPGDFYLNYHLYRDVFPVMALGRVLGDRG